MTTAPGTLPTFLIIGAYKAGTTSLYHYLRAHPQVFMTEEKETFYFTDHAHHHGREWYEAQFAAGVDAVARGEASTAYSAWPNFKHVPERASELVPEARIVYLLRHPIERLQSQYLFDARMFRDRRPIDTAILDEIRYVSRSRYAMQIDRWLAHYPRENLLLLTTEELRRDRRRTLRRVFEFIGVDADFFSPLVNREHNRRQDLRADGPLVQRLRGTPAHRAARHLVPADLRHRFWRLTSTEPTPREARISPELEARLLDLLRNDIERLPSFLGPQFDCWGLL